MYKWRLPPPSKRPADAYRQGQRRRNRVRARHDRAPGRRTRRTRDSALLLSRAPVHRRQLPHVPGRGEAWTAEAAGLVRASGRRRPGNLHRHADGQEGPGRGDGVPAHQPPAGLPDLRPGRRVRPAGPVGRLRPRRLALFGEQARGRRKGDGSDHQDLHDALHPVHALRPLHHRSRRRAGHRHDLARRGRRDHDLSGEVGRLGIVGQRQ